MTTTNCTGSLRPSTALVLVYATSTEHRFESTESRGGRMKCTECDAGRFLRSDQTMPNHKPVRRAHVVIPA